MCIHPDATASNSLFHDQIHDKLIAKLSTDSKDASSPADFDFEYNKWINYKSIHV